MVTAKMQVLDVENISYQRKEWEYAVYPPGKPI